MVYINYELKIYIGFSIMNSMFYQKLFFQNILKNKSWFYSLFCCKLKVF